MEEPQTGKKPDPQSETKPNETHPRAPSPIKEGDDHPQPKPEKNLPSTPRGAGPQPEPKTIIKEVIKEVPVEKIVEVEKEVVKEVIKEVPVIDEKLVTEKAQALADKIITEKSQSNLKNLRTKANQERQNRHQENLQKILTFTQEKKLITNQQIRDLLRVSQSTATKYLHELVAQNKLRKRGSAKATQYQIK